MLARHHWVLGFVNWSTWSITGITKVLRDLYASSEFAAVEMVARMALGMFIECRMDFNTSCKRHVRQINYFNQKKTGIRTRVSNSINSHSAVFLIITRTCIPDVVNVH